MCHLSRECSEAGWTAALLIFLLVTGVMLLFFQYSWNFPYSHNLSNMIMSGFTMPIPLTLKDASCQVPWTCACPVHSNVSWIDPALLRLYLHFFKLCHGLEGPGIPEDNSSQKTIKSWRRHSVPQCFPCPFSPHQGFYPVQHEGIPSTFQFSFCCWYSSESPHHLSPVTAASVPTALCYKGQLLLLRGPLSFPWSVYKAASHF